MKKGVIILTVVIAAALCCSCKSSSNGQTELDIPSEKYILENGYPENQNGETYGPDLAEGPDSDIGTPDLQLTEATNGKTGYIRTSDLNDGVNTPEEALEFVQKGSGKMTVSVYLQDGITVVGEFAIG